MISVIIPVYNAHKFLDVCLTSLVKQMNNQCEIILINDGSVDESGALCDFYASKYEQIYAFHQNNKGASAARNFGINVAKGEYLTFVDSDDFVEDTYLSTILSYIQEVNFEILNFNLTRIEKSGSYELTNGFNGQFTHSDYLNTLAQNNIKYLWFPVNKVYRSSFIKTKNLFFDENLKIGEDTMFNLRCFYFAEKIYFTNERLYNYVSNPNSTIQQGYKHDLTSNMELHFHSRLSFHLAHSDINGTKFYEAIAKYYLEHIFFLILRNLQNKPGVDWIFELNELRIQDFIKFSLKHYRGTYKKQFKQKLLIFLFDKKLFRLLKAVY